MSTFRSFSCFFITSVKNQIYIYFVGASKAIFFKKKNPFIATLGIFLRTLTRVMAVREEVKVLRLAHFLMLKVQSLDGRWVGLDTKIEGTEYSIRDNERTRLKR